MDGTQGGRRDTIRPAQPDDRDAILAVARSSGLFAAGELAEVGKTLQVSLPATTNGEQWLVDDAGAPGIVGVALYAPERMAEGVWNLLMLVVRPDWQGAGRGRSLVARVEQELAGRSRMLLIETSGTEDFVARRAFYTGLGYRIEARIREFYGTGDDKVVFVKSMSGGIADGRDRASPPGGNHR